MQAMWVQSLGQEDPLEKAIAIYSSVLARKIPPTEESGGLQFMGSDMKVFYRFNRSLLLLFSHSVMSNSLQPRGLQQARSPCPSPSPRVCPSSHSLHQWCHPAISSSDTLFFCPQSFSVSGTFPVSCLSASDDQTTRASGSASVLLVNIQGWSPLRLTGWVSLLSMGLSGVVSSTIGRNHQFFGTLPSLQSSSHNKSTWPLGRP